MKLKNTCSLEGTGFLCGSVGKESACNAVDLGLIPGLRRSLGEGKGYSSILAWRIRWTVQTMGSQRVGHDSATFTHSLGKKAMTNLDNMLKSKNITLPTMFHIVKAMILPVVMYRSESWTIKEAEHLRFDAF